MFGTKLFIIIALIGLACLIVGAKRNFRSRPRPRNRDQPGNPQPAAAAEPVPAIRVNGNWKEVLQAKAVQFGKKYASKAATAVGTATVLGGGAVLAGVATDAIDRAQESGTAASATTGLVSNSSVQPVAGIPIPIPITIVEPVKSAKKKEGGLNEFPQEATVNQGWANASVAAICSGTLGSLAVLLGFACGLTKIIKKLKISGKSNKEDRPDEEGPEHIELEGRLTFK